MIFLDFTLSEFVLEKLLEKRDYYLNTIKHLEFQLIMDPTEDEIQLNPKLKIISINELEQIEKEIGLILSKK